ncbi:MAG: polyphosphate polymerase domain-containing protein [Acidimicrobiia bacterium]
MNDLPVDNLQSVGLTELNREAELLTRRDRKYLVPMALARSLVENSSNMQVLKIGGRHSFRYESVYFDTPDLVSYLAAAHKRRRRFKVRTRSYLDSGSCSLEVKTRERRGLTEKHRLPYELEGRSTLSSEALEFIDGFERIAPVSRQLEPVLTTRYERTTLLEPHSKSRITIDTNLEVEAADGSKLTLPGMAVVETKTAGRPCAVDHFLWSRHQRPAKISKYCTGLAALTPGLPANKWNRVLRTYFGWTPRAIKPAAGGREPSASDPSEEGPAAGSTPTMSQLQDVPISYAS